MRLIDADALTDKMDIMISDAILADTAIHYALIRELVAEQPTIEAEPMRHGRWIPTEYDSYAGSDPVWDKWECSECGHEHSGEEDTLTAFCPDCGTKMDATDTNVGGKGGADNV